MTVPDAHPVLRPVLYTDLDDTLFQTGRKMSEPPREAQLAARATNGHHSYMTDAQARLAAWLFGATRAIPVTARSTEALARCRLPFDDWRIAANGAVILDRDGRPDPEWQARVAAVAARCADGLAALEQDMRSRNADTRFRHWIVTEAGMPIYFCVKSNGDAAWLDEVWSPLREIAGSGFTPHRNGNNLSFTPLDISKLGAVRYLDDRIGGDAPRFGMGDSLTDLPFMAICDMMLVPPGSQIATAIGKA